MLKSKLNHFFLDLMACEKLVKSWINKRKTLDARYDMQILGMLEQLERNGRELKKGIEEMTENGK